MCRSHADGGRLCPSQTDPVLIANRNARRRAAYAKKKQLSPTVTEVGAKVAHAALQPRRKHSLFKYKKEDSDQVLYSALDSKETTLGLTSVAHEGYLVDKTYLSGTQNSGLIDYTKLDEESYLDFGFQPISQSRYSGMPLKEFVEVSKSELKDIPRDEKQALRFFTSAHFGWVNKALYQQNQEGDVEPVLMPDQGEHKSRFDGKKFSKKEEFNPDYDELKYTEKTPSLIEELTTKIDSAMEKSHKQQRIVYRGINIYHPAVLAYGKQHKSAAVGTVKYVEDHYALGQEVTFDGYQSTSFSPTVAADYASENGIVFEIKASSGLNVSSVSHFDIEQEVIMPRNSRYMVVGVHHKQEYIYGDNGKYQGTQKLNVVQLVEITDDGYVRDESNAKKSNPLDKSKLPVYDD
jgi:hypothetical protein